MKVKVEFTLDIDLADWRAEYGEHETAAQARSAVIAHAEGVTEGWLDDLGIGYTAPVAKLRERYSVMKGDV